VTWLFFPLVELLARLSLSVHPPLAFFLTPNQGALSLPPFFAVFFSFFPFAAEGTGSNVFQPFSLTVAGAWFFSLADFTPRSCGGGARACSSSFLIHGARIGGGSSSSREDL